MRTLFLAPLAAVVAISSSAQEAAAPAAKDPQRLSLMREAHEKAVERAVAPLRLAYLTELKKLKVEYTMAADLAGAEAVEKEIVTLQAEIEAALPAGFVGEWSLDEGKTRHVFLEGGVIESWTLVKGKPKKSDLMKGWKWHQLDGLSATLFDQNQVEAGKYTLSAKGGLEFVSKGKTVVLTRELIPWRK